MQKGRDKERTSRESRERARCVAWLSPRMRADDVLREVWDLRNLPRVLCISCIRIRCPGIPRNSGVAVVVVVATVSFFLSLFLLSVAGPRGSDRATLKLCGARQLKRVTGGGLFAFPRRRWPYPSSFVSACDSYRTRYPALTEECTGVSERGIFIQFLSASSIKYGGE